MTNPILIRLSSMVLIVLLFASSRVIASEFDAKRRLLCTVVEGMEYRAGGNVKNFNPESVGLPRKFVIDFRERIIRPTKNSIIQNRSKIKRIEKVENKLILQGAEDGVEGVNDGIGWSIAISREGGNFVTTASGENVGYIVFGSCSAESPSENH